ncbi:MAG TPA: glycine cleavage system protein GcvH [Rhodothermales bacterium]|nr:glycine cleavage system protein GcvH [Rhodothermales bacterium]
MKFPDDRRYTREHEWIKLEGDGSTAVVGITDFAQGELGDVIFVELSKVGTAVESDGAFGTVEAVKTVSDLFMPVAGRIVAINEALEATPEVVNESPYDEGWMIKIHVDDPATIESLMTSAEYAEMVGG